ncbi:hypothetical protein [Carnobacterium pleistocenium]|uniref:hypothetical protein n=1 Tax=Carnobacterium pleistocenium TaxID=181073 RepID=UPI0005583B6C|nr:hypothetical protein [Carnobacterium pleistocenium]
MRDDIAEGLGKTGNRQADIEIRQDTLEDDFVAVQQDASSASPSGAEVVLARGGYETLGKRLTEEETQISAQLEKKTELKIFSHIPSSSELSINELGLVLIPRFPIAESFNEVDGIGWNSFKFSTGNTK